MNSLGHLDHRTGELELIYAGDQKVFEEPQFVPRGPGAPEGNGFLLAIRHAHDTMLSELVVLDTADLVAGPVCVAKLPFRVRPGVHGTWVQEGWGAPVEPGGSSGDRVICCRRGQYLWRLLLYWLAVFLSGMSWPGMPPVGVLRRTWPQRPVWWEADARRGFATLEAAQRGDFNGHL